MASAEIYDPSTGQFAPAGAMRATLLKNGKVLVFGGENAQAFPTSTVMLFE